MSIHTVTFEKQNSVVYSKRVSIEMFLISPSDKKALHEQAAECAMIDWLNWRKNQPNLAPVIDCDTVVVDGVRYPATPRGIRHAQKNPLLHGLSRAGDGAVLTSLKSRPAHSGLNSTNRVCR